MHPSIETVSGWSPQPSQLLLATGALLLALKAYYSIISRQRNPKDIQAAGGFSILNTWKFYTRRYDFLKTNFAKTGQNLFSFKVLHHSVVAMRGETARKVFFDNPHLDFVQGYSILLGGGFDSEDVDVSNEKPRDPAWTKQQMLAIMSKDRITEVIPTLFHDLQRRMEGWGEEGVIDTFKCIFDLVFQTTIRMTACSELATDIPVVDELQATYWDLENSATPIALLLPWIPSQSKKNARIANKKLYNTLTAYVERRKAATAPTSDAIDFLLSRGLTQDEVVGFVLNITLSGFVNTSLATSWILVHLAFDKESKQGIIAEVNSIIENHTNTTSTDPIHQRLAAVPLAAWENEMPMFDLVIRETLRISFNGTAPRRNVYEDLDISGKLVGKGNFLVYNLSDAHLNPNIYTNPSQFDPMRFAPGREEDKKETFAFLGWGAGRHPCPGTRVAKLEIKIITALILTAYEYDVVGDGGCRLECPPKPDHNIIHLDRPTKEPCYFRYSYKHVTN